jgi:hypothetical protein
MDGMAVSLFAAYLPAMRAGMLAAMQNAYDERLGVETGTLRRSIAVDLQLPGDTGGRTILDARITAGGIDDDGTWAWYGWFHEFGTGAYTERPNIARWVGYKDSDGTWKPFNMARPGAGNGWLIMTRGENGAPVRFLSRGQRARHWFSHGVTKAVNLFNRYAAEINGDLIVLRELSREMQQLRSMVA